MFATKKSAYTRNFLELGWRILWNFDSFLADEIVFFIIRRTVVLDNVFLATSSDDAPTQFLMLCNIFRTFLLSQNVVLQFLASLRIVKDFHSL
jgi:hypothetical protein